MVTTPLEKSSKRTNNWSNPSTPSPSVVRRYVKWVAFLIAVIILISCVVVFIAYRCMGAEFDTDVLTGNDIPLSLGTAAAGAGVGMVLLSLLSPVDLIRGDVAGGLLDEIELPERGDKDKKTKDKNVSDKNVSDKNASKDAARRRAADANTRKNRERARKRNVKNHKKRTRVSRKRRRLKKIKRLRSMGRATRGVRFFRGFVRLLLRR